MRRLHETFNRGHQFFQFFYVEKTWNIRLYSLIFIILKLLPIPIENFKECFWQPQQCYDFLFSCIGYHIVKTHFDFFYLKLQGIKISSYRYLFDSPSWKTLSLDVPSWKTLSLTTIGVLFIFVFLLVGARRTKLKLKL